MQSRGARIGIAAAAIAAVVVLFVVLRGGDDEPSTTTTPVAEQDGGDEPEAGAPVNPTDKPKPKPKPEVAITEIEVEAGAPVGGVREISLDSGEKARIVVTTPDTTDHVHLHGYDVIADLAPGSPAKLEFEADIDGIFEIELEERVVPLAEVTVGKT